MNEYIMNKERAKISRTKSDIRYSFAFTVFLVFIDFI